MGDAYENAEQNDENRHTDGEPVSTRPCGRLLLGSLTVFGGFGGFGGRRRAVRCLASLLDGVLTGLRTGMAVGVLIGGLLIGVVADMLAGRWAALVIFLIQHIVHSNENHSRSAGR